MNSLFLFNTRNQIGGKPVEFTIIFFYQPELDFDMFISAIDEHFRENLYPEKIFLLLPTYIRVQFTEAYTGRHSDLQKAIPVNDDRKNIDKYFIPIYYDSNGSLTILNKEASEEVQAILEKGFNDALVDIFNKRDGLIIAEAAHHFIFPSGKHCDHFLRTGNILQKGNEIMFIAFFLLKKLRNNAKVIYCDTSSINSLAYALIQLRRNFNAADYRPPYVESFGSYEAFENGEFSVLVDSLVLVSSSTSGRIIKRLTDKGVKLSQIFLIYSMEKHSDYSETIICDLKYDEQTNEYGIRTFKSYESETDCAFCKDGSMAIEVTGDVFQLEKPAIKKILIKKIDSPKSLSTFIETFHKRKQINFELIKTHYY